MLSSRCQSTGSKGDLRTYSPLGVSSFNCGASNSLMHSFIEFILDLFSCFGHASLLPHNHPLGLLVDWIGLDVDGDLQIGS